jgi:hypothetical protein
MDTTQELVATLSTDLDATGTEIQGVKKKLMRTIREKAILEAQLRGDPVLPSEYDSIKPKEYLPKSPPRKRVTMESPATAPAIIRVSLGIRATRIFQVVLFGLLGNSGIRKCYPKSGFQKLSPKF